MIYLQLLLGLSILVALHELGHFLAARAFKTRVEKFYLFFDFLFPIPTLLNFALFKKKIGDTEYGIGWFPLGGYVKIAGMMDESMDEEQMKLPPKPDEYRSKKNWQKLIIMLGGIIMNVIVAWVIYSQLLFWGGEAHIPADATKYGIHADTLAQIAGFREGDIVLSHDGGQKFESFTNIPREVLLDDIKTIEVRRDGRETSFNVPADFKAKAVAMGAKVKGFIEPRMLCVVDTFSSGSVVSDKFKKGDRVISINDHPINYFQDAPPVVSALKNQDAHVVFLRGEDTMSFTVRVPETGLLGFSPERDSTAIGYTEIHYSFLQSFGGGAKRASKEIRDYFKQLKLIFSPTVKGYKQLGGIGSMASMYGAGGPVWDWYKFWSTTAFISVVLAIMNLLPIPMLDGGYVIILLIEMALGRPLNEKVLENIQRVGFILIVFLMLYANGNDIYRHVAEKYFQH
ncbi:MAG: RIP metalloprotease RseP [Bacteroidetes bacterium]|nr:RIP metalloprotease RseP [Bacteroidota bacterium]